VAVFALFLLLSVFFLAGPVLAAPHTQSRGYVVQPGDSLSEIAERARVPVEELMAMNGIDDADDITIGQVLLLPARNEMPVQTPPAVGVDVRFVGEPQTDVHIVQAGESLSEIAERYDMDMTDLMQLNGITDADAVIEGQRLRLTHAVNTGTARPAATQQAPEPEAIPGPASRVITSLNRTVRIEFGEDLASIAIRYGVDEDALRAINGLEDAQPEDLEIGRELILPATAQELQVARAAPQVARVEHVVEEGESLGIVAEQYGLSLAELMEANYISDPDTIYVGQRLVIPVEPDVPVETEGTAAQIGRPRSGFYYYTVKPGDTLSELARDFDSTQLAIMEYNDLPDAETVYNGLPLRIPYGPPPLPIETPPTPLAGTRFLVSLSRQQCWVLDGDQVLYQWTCSTGYGKWITRTGAFAVQTKQEMAESNAYELDMPYWLGIYDVGTYENGIHGLPISWKTGQKIWDGLVGMPATFGCAMLDDDHAATLYDLAYLGMPVYIVP
jgi:LysM repeat protein